VALLHGKARCPAIKLCVGGHAACLRTVTLTSALSCSTAQAVPTHLGRHVRTLQNMCLPHPNHENKNKVEIIARTHVHVVLWSYTSSFVARLAEIRFFCVD
jgi:hypothetical protein